MRTRKSPLPPEAPRKCERSEKPLSWRGLERILRGLVVSQYPPSKATPGHTGAVKLGTEKGEKIMIGKSPTLLTREL
jgi:hypothetical protein